MCVMRELESHAALWFDPRQVLRDVYLQCRSAGLAPVLACELEFYLVQASRTAQGQLQPACVPRTGAPPARPMNLCLDSVEDHAQFLERINQAAIDQDLPVAGVVCEYGLGQFEINLRHLPDPVLAADHAVLLRRLVRGTARSLGMDATFIAKPFLHEPGSGLHVHLSLADETGSSRFAPPLGDRLLRNAIAGMQAMMFDSMALFAPNINSYRRLRSSSIQSGPSWGYNNRSAALRIPAGDPRNTRIEHRAATADASPHLTVAAILAAVHYGVTSMLEPGPASVGIVDLPRHRECPLDLADALQRLERSKILPAYFSQRYLSAYAQHKRGEYAALFEGITPQELDFYA